MRTMRPLAFGGAPYMGHETCEGCAEWCAGTPREPCHWGIRWASLWDNETCEGCVGCGYAMRTLPLGPSVELPMGPRNV